MNPLGVLNEVINKQLGFDDNELLDLSYSPNNDETRRQEPSQTELQVHEATQKCRCTQLQNAHKR